MRFFSSNPAFGSMQFIPLKDEEYFNDLKHSGAVVATCLKTFKNLIDNKANNINLLDIEAECVKIIDDNKCTPTFKNYKGFPGAVCLSVNKSLVHGIPHDYILNEGDVVTLDLGATTESGVIADAAVTAIYGRPKNITHVKMLQTCQESLYKAIRSIKIGNHLGCIGSAIHHHTKSSGFKLITNYGGHGIDRNKAHAQPFVSNKADKNEGIRIQPGLTIAIEPMLAIGSNKTRKLSDNWTVVTNDIGVHVEHSIFVTEHGPFVATKWEDENII